MVGQSELLHVYTLDDVVNLPTVIILSVLSK